MRENETGNARNVHGEVNNVCRFLNRRHPRRTLKDNIKKILREEDIKT
jgi:ribosomal protein S28E/S33